jgi:virginiamycin B lyase
MLLPITELKVATASEGPYGVTLAGGELWTTLVHAGVVARVVGGEVERFDLGAAGSRPSVIVGGPDGAVWFTRNGDDRIGRIDPSHAALADAAGAAEAAEAGRPEIAVVAEVAGAPFGLCVGPDAALWFTLMNSDRIGRLTPDGQVTEFPIGTTGGFPAMITADEDLWFTLNQGNAIGRMTVTGEVTTFPLPTAAAGPVGISAGPHGVWLVEIIAGQVGRIDRDGTIEEFPLPDRASKPHAVVATEDGGCWVTLWGSGELIRLDSAGTVVEQHELGAGSEPHGLAVAADGSVWVALETGVLAHIHASE